MLNNQFVERNPSLAHGPNDTLDSFIAAAKRDMEMIFYEVSEP